MIDFQHKLKSTQLYGMVKATNKPLRVAVLFDQQLQSGGGYQQALNAAILVKKLPAELVTPIFFTSLKCNITILRSFDIEAVYLDIGWFKRRRLEMRCFFWPIICKFFKNIASQNCLEFFFSRFKIDLVYFLSPNPNARYLETLNFIFTLWDLSHLDNPEFPEVRANREFECREKLLRAILPKAVAILVDTDTSISKVVHRYVIDGSRVFAMPFSPAQGSSISDKDYNLGYINIKSKYELCSPYIFYPAQFWSHKNHVYILHGLQSLKQDYGHQLAVIFAGSDKGNLKYIRSVAELLGLSRHVRFVGFVPNNEIPYLYKQSLALVMPTYFGPTNIPPLEAFALGVPVLYSNKPGLKDQVGNAALLLDLDDPGSMASLLANLIEDPKLGQMLITDGKKLLAKTNDNDRSSALITILTRYQKIRICWE